MTYYISIEDSQAARAKIAGMAREARCACRTRAGRAVICETDRGGFPADTGAGRSIAAACGSVHSTDSDDIDAAARAWL